VVVRTWFLPIVILFSSFVSACSNQEGRPTPTEAIYRPPTQIPVEVPTVTETGVEALQDEGRSTPTPFCTNGLWFLGDLTIPDGTVVNPGERLDKRWEVQNNGTCNWDQHYRVKLIAGPGMGIPVQRALIPALSGTEVVIRMVLIAPDEPGNYRSAWQAYDPQDNPFGDLFFIDIVVLAPEVVTDGE
jgi:hypothetical protein